MASTEKGALFPAEGDMREGVLNFIKQAISKGCFDAVLIPAKVPGNDSFTYLLIRDESLLENAYPLPPVMSVQGAKAISSLTRQGKGQKKIAALVRPCELSFFFQAEDGIRDSVASRGLGDVYKRQA